MNEQIHKNNSSTKEENQLKEMCTLDSQQKRIPYISDPNIWYQHLLDVRDGYAESDSQGRYMVGSGRKFKELKEVRQKENLVVNLVTTEAQALEMAKSELRRKGEESLTGRGRKTATMDWNSLRC